MRQYSHEPHADHSHALPTLSPTFRSVDAVAERDDGAVALMAGDERRLRLDGPITLCGMQIGVADAGGFQLDQRFAVAGRWQVEFLDLQRSAEFGDDGGTHGVGGVGGAGCAECLCHFSIPLAQR